MPIDRPLLDRAETFVRARLEGRACGHDWWHIHRVRALALRLAPSVDADPALVELAALLHDVADPKLDGHPGEGLALLARWLDAAGLSAPERDRLEDILARISFSSGLEGASSAPARPKSPELMAVQDADRLDAIGALGIARVFAYGGSKGQPLHDPGLPPRAGFDAKAYRAAGGGGGGSTSLNHFHEKLLKLKDLMNTPAGRDLAEERHAYMESFLARFGAEWDGRA